MCCVTCSGQFTPPNTGGYGHSVLAANDHFKSPSQVALTVSAVCFTVAWFFLLRIPRRVICLRANPPTARGYLQMACVIGQTVTAFFAWLAVTISRPAIPSRYGIGSAFHRFAALTSGPRHPSWALATCDPDRIRKRPGVAIGFINMCAQPRWVISRNSRDW
jgi:hypothetical protein